MAALHSNMVEAGFRKQEVSDEETGRFKYPNPPLPAEPGRFRQVTDTAWRGRIYKLSLDGKLLGMLGQSGKQLKQFGWIHALACPSENMLWVGELLNWRAQKLVLHP
jgi:cytochrome b561